MEYPKQVMTMPELVSMGFPQELLKIAYRAKGQTFAQKINPAVRNSTIFFDTVGFEEWRMDRLRAENCALPR